MDSSGVNAGKDHEWVRTIAYHRRKQKSGSLIRLDQLIKVTRQEEAPQSYYRINGLNSIYLSIRAEETANQLQLAKKVKEEMEHIRTLLPPGLRIHTSYDATEFIQEELDKIYGPYRA